MHALFETHGLLSLYGWQIITCTITHNDSILHKWSQYLFQGLYEIHLTIATDMCIILIGMCCACIK